MDIARPEFKTQKRRRQLFILAAVILGLAAGSVGVSQLKADRIWLQMTNPQREQAAVDAQLQLKAAEAEYQNLRVKLESDLMNQKAGAATVHDDDAQAQRQAQTDKALFELGVISGMAYKTSKDKA